MSVSEVAQMRAQIELEYVAMKRGLLGVAAGVAKHRFIAAKMERVGELTDQLAQQIGQQQATTIAAQTYMRIMEETTDGSERPSEAQEQEAGKQEQDRAPRTPVEEEGGRRAMLASPIPSHPVCTREEVAQKIKARIADPEEADILLDRLWDAWELLDELKHRLGKRAARRALCTPAHWQAESVCQCAPTTFLSRGGK